MHATTSPPEVVCLEVTGDGLGDHMMALTVTTGWKRDHPRGQLILAANPALWLWLDLFGGYDSMCGPYPHAGRVPPGMSIPYQKRRPPRGVPLLHDVRNRGDVHYTVTVERLPASSRAMPILKPLPAEAVAWAAAHRGAVVLAPTAANPSRIWHPFRWLHLEEMLLSRGASCVVVAGPKDGERLREFRSPVHCGESPARVVALFRAAAVVVANESGPAHLAGALQVPAVVLAAQHPDVHGFWSRSRVLAGPLHCTGCHTVGPHFRPACVTVCDSLQAIQPGRVLEAVLPHLPGGATVCPERVLEPA